jgi:putative membrane protein
MLTDFLLAALHHVLIFGLVTMLVAESVLLRGGVDAGVLRRLAGLDRGYGTTALALLAVGILRVFLGIKGEDFYLHNPWFHAKVGLYVLVGLLSIAPTLNFVRWRKALRADPSFLPEPAQVTRATRLVRMELALVGAIFVIAAGMARYGGL